MRRFLKFKNSQWWRGGWVMAMMGLCLGASWLVSPARADEQDPMKQKISIELVDADLRDAVRAVFEGTGLNFVIDDGVIGSGVTIKLENVERGRVLRHVLESRGFEAWPDESGIYRIRNKPRPATSIGVGTMFSDGTRGIPGAGLMPSMPVRRNPIPQQIHLKHKGATEILALLTGRGSVYGGAGTGAFGGQGSFGGLGTGGGSTFGGGSAFGGGIRPGAGSTFGGGVTGGFGGATGGLGIGAGAY